MLIMFKLFFISLLFIQSVSNAAENFTPPWKLSGSTSIIPRSSNVTSVFGNSAFSLSVGGTAASTAQLDVLPSTSSTIGEIIKGASSQSADLLELQDNSANVLFKADKNSDVTYQNSNFTMGTTRTFFDSNSTISINANLGFIAFFASHNAINYSATPIFGVPPVFFNFSSSISAVTNGLTLQPPVAFENSETLTANGVVWTALDTVGAFTDSPTFSISNSGSFSGYGHTSYASYLTINTGATVAIRRAMQVHDATGSGTLTNQYGLAIDDLTKGSTTNIPIYVKGTTGKSRHQPKIKFGADSDPSVDVDVNGWINYAGATRVSTQFDKTNTTLANVTGLSVTTVSGRTYSFKAKLFIDSSAIGGYKLAIAGTNTATAIIYNINVLNNATNAFTITSRQTALGGSSGSAVGTGEYAEINGLITVNAGGTLTVQFAQNVANGTSSVLVGSTFEVWDTI